MTGFIPDISCIKALKILPFSFNKRIKIVNPITKY